MRLALGMVLSITLVAWGCGDNNDTTGGTGGGGAGGADAGPTWGDAESIGHVATISSGYLRLHLDPDSNVLATWLGTGHLWTNVRVNGGGWGDAEPLGINQENNRFVADLHAAVLEAGTVLMLWSQASDIMAARYRVGEGWTGPDRISTEERAHSPWLATDLNGHAFATWSDRRTIWVSRYASDGEWNPPEAVASNDEVWYPQVAMDTDGRALLVWLGAREYPESLYLFFSLGARRYDPNTGWDAVESPGECSWHDTTCPFQLATGKGGVARLAWWDYGLFDTRLFAPDSGWSDTTELGKDDWGPEDVKVYGDTGLAWTDADGIHALGSPVLEALEGGPIDRLPNIGFGPDGEAHAVWVGDGGAVLASRYSPGSGWRDPIVLDEKGNRPGTFPQIVVDERGHATAAWMESDTVRTARLEITQPQ